jgi:hypothetical protein
MELGFAVDATWFEGPGALVPVVFPTVRIR